MTSRGRSESVIGRDQLARGHHLVTMRDIVSLCVDATL
jgi:hypothetical protein